jgi:hypothetical protein
MSSALSVPRPTTAPEVAPTEAARTEPAEHVAVDTGPVAPSPAPTTDEIDRGFGAAIVWGSIVGIVVFAVLIAIGTVLAARSVGVDLEAGAVAAIAVWTGIWGGLFLGGTVAVGRWSMRQGH